MGLDHLAQVCDWQANVEGFELDDFEKLLQFIAVGVKIGGNKVVQRQKPSADSREAHGELDLCFQNFFLGKLAMRNG